MTCANESSLCAARFDAASPNRTLPTDSWESILTGRITAGERGRGSRRRITEISRRRMPSAAEPIAAARKRKMKMNPAREWKRWAAVAESVSPVASNELKRSPSPEAQLLLPWAPRLPLDVPCHGKRKVHRPRHGYRLAGIAVRAESRSHSKPSVFRPSLSTNRPELASRLPTKSAAH